MAKRARGVNLTLNSAVRRLLRDAGGQDLIEYALLVGCIALLVVGAVQLVGSRVGTVYATVVSALSSGNASGSDGGDADDGSGSESGNGRGTGSGQGSGAGNGNGRGSGNGRGNGG